MNPDPRYWKLSITSYVRVLALECLAGKGWVRQCDLRAYMIQNISPEDACRYREHVIKVRKWCEPPAPCRRRSPWGGSVLCRWWKRPCGEVYSKRMNLAQLPTVVGTHNVQLTSRCTGVPHALFHLHSRRPRLP